jgi:hypothetical protein
VSALDDAALLAALRRYVRACGGDPDGASLDAVAAERDIEEAIDAYEAEHAPVLCVQCCEEVGDDE